jgi:Ca2+-binding RTX toxin-like protein
VANAGDINGDGFTDLMVSAPNGDPGAGVRSNAGQTFVIFGGISGVSTTAIDFMGTAGNDTLNGTSTTSNLNEQLVGGAGNDTLYGGGGADVMYGGTGNDTFVVNADNVTQLGSDTGNTSQDIARIDGGSGLDTIQLDGAGLLFDLSLIRGPAIQNVEKIDLTGTGNNTLKLTLTDVLQSFDNLNVFNSSNTTSGLSATVSKNQLMVDGDAGDKVVLSDLASWTAAGTNVVSNGHTYVA